MIIGVLCLVVICIIATHFLIPLPLLSHQQGDIEIDYGEVTGMKSIRPGVLEISLKQNIEINPCSQGKVIGMTSASCTRFIHFRKGQLIPRIGERISVSSINRLHHFTGRSFNWAKGWTTVNGAIPTGGKIELVVT